MARRRLLSILAGSALLTASLAGPAAAVELVGASQDSVAEVTEETVEVADPDAVEAAVEAVVETVAETPVAEVAAVVEETVAPSSSPSPSPSPAPSPAPSPTPAEEPAAAVASSDDSGTALVAAGDVTAAPSLAFLTGTGGSAPAVQARLDLPSMPALTAAPSSSEAVEAPQVAPAPAAVAETQTPSALAQSVSRAVHDEGTPFIVLVAIASLLAAGLSTVREARAVAAA